MGVVAKRERPGAAAEPDGTFAGVLGPRRERCLIEEMAECKRTLAELLGREGGHAVPQESGDPRAMSRLLADVYRDHGPMEGTAEAVFRRYFQIRNELMLANMRLVAYVARRYRNRGVAYSDLLQEGYCGLLEAIDRFDPAHATKLATYATWWIRQAVQSAVAAGAYSVRLSPRHLRQLARNADEVGAAAARRGEADRVGGESLQRIQAATRPAVALDETRLGAPHTALDPESDRAEEVDLDEAVDRWMVSLRPRERQVLSYRYGLGGSPALSLSQVGQVLEVSKERVRQIQNAALKMLREQALPDISIVLG